MRFDGTAQRRVIERLIEQRERRERELVRMIEIEG